MLSGEKPGYKHQRKIERLYEQHRRAGTPQVLRRVAKGKRGFVPMASVVQILRYIFQPTDAQTIPTDKRPWQDRRTRFASSSRSVRGEFDSWDGFSIVMVEGSSDMGSTSVRRYKPRGGGQHHLDFIEERQEVEEMEGSPDIAELVNRWDTLSERYKRIVSHLPVGDWIELIDEHGSGEIIFNFWVTRFSERPKAGGFGNARDPNDPTTFKVMVSVVEDAVEIANSESDHFSYSLIGVYAFTSWNKKAGKKPPRQ